MERIILKNVSKKFRIGFQKKQSILGRIINTISGRIPTKIILAIDNISFTAQSGDIIGLIGKNGSGKSTFLRLIAGIYLRNEGEISTHGKIISLINLSIGLKLRLTMKDNIYLIGSLLGLGYKDIKNRFDRIVEFAELDKYINTKISQLSSGMRERLVFSIAINANPDIILLDEVFEVGDEDFKKKSARKIRELAKNGATIFLVSHELWMIEKYCNRAVLMNNGKIVDQGDGKSIIREYIKLSNN
ncbi:ABC transporter ATP-binding protein [Spirochaetota bacterium]